MSRNFTSRKSAKREHPLDEKSLWKSWTPGPGRVGVFRAKAAVVNFDARALFPSTDRLSVPLLRLMAATNDVRHLQKLVLVQFDEEPKTNVGRLTREGELRYLLRMLCGHLHEAGIAFRNLDCECKRRVEALVAKDQEAKQLFKQLRNIYNDSSKHGLRNTLDAIRNLTFHYDGQDFADSLRLNWPTARLVIASMGGLSRYTFTDDILMHRTIEAIGGIENFETKVVGDAINLAGTLAQAVDHLLNAILSQHLDNTQNKASR